MKKVLKSKNWDWPLGTTLVWLPGTFSVGREDEGKVGAGG
jgi:hypothetical protein